MAAEIRAAKYEWLLLSIILGIFSHIARAMRWNILIRSLGYKTDTPTTFYAVMTGYLANMAFPRLGEVTRCGVLSRKKGSPFQCPVWHRHLRTGLRYDRPGVHHPGW
ncbi:MAG: flippase-like domain-containing protein [Marinilabiliales bacterium]|nr:flippase-like domain-containing protein [Marinilabiliales bacterium]